MKKIVFLISILALVSFASCTKNARVKHLGGSMTIELEPNQKFIDVTWKENELWILTCPMDSLTDSLYKPRTYRFYEKSSLGIMEGEITFKESRTIKSVK